MKEFFEVNNKIDEYINSLNLKELNNDELNTLIRYKISASNFLPRLKTLFNMLIYVSHLTNNKAIFVLKNLKDNQKFKAYCYRHLVKSAYYNDVPKVIINNYTEKKNSYNMVIKHDYLKEHKIDSKIQLVDSVVLLIETTIEMVNFKNSRKEKILNIMSKNN